MRVNLFFIISSYPMRKVLFWVLIVVLLFLLFVLGYSFRTQTTPLNVLKRRFGVEQTVQVTTQEGAQQAQFVDTTTKIKTTVKTESGTYVPATGTTTNVSGDSLSEQDKKDVQDLIDSLVVK